MSIYETANHGDSAVGKTSESSEDTLQALVNSSAVATFAISPDHKVIYWNTACEELTGLKAEEVMGTGNHWRAFYPRARPCLADIVISREYARLPELYPKYGPSALQKDGLYAEGWYESLGGRKRFIIFDAVPVYNRHGELVAVAETLQDITSHKQNDAELSRILNLIQNAADKKTLPGYIPICSSCKNIRDAKGAWVLFEEYLTNRIGIKFTHSICPACAKKLYPKFIPQ